MSYSEENGLVILSMSREDWEMLEPIFKYGQAEAVALDPDLEAVYDRLNSGNPHYTPYQVEAKKSGIDSRNGLPHIPDVD